MKTRRPRTTALVHSTTAPTGLANVIREMTAALTGCATIGESVEIADKAAAIAAYAVAMRDRALEVWATELRLRAGLRLGELIAAIAPAAALGHGRYRLPVGGKTKAEVLAEAKLTPGHAYALQELAGGTDPARQAAANAAADRYFLECRSAGRPGTVAGLRLAIVGQAVRQPAMHTERPAEHSKPVAAQQLAHQPGATLPPMLPSGDDFVRLAAAARFLSRIDPARMPGFARRAGSCTEGLLAEAKAAELVISVWIAQLSTVASAYRRAAATDEHRAVAA